MGGKRGGIKGEGQRAEGNAAIDWRAMTNHIEIGRQRRLSHTGRLIKNRLLESGKVLCYVLFISEFHLPFRVL